MLESSLYINLSSALNNPRITTQNPRNIVIIADTVEIPDDFTFSLEDQTMIIVARRIVGGGSGTIFLDTMPNSNEAVTIFSPEVSANLNVIALSQDDRPVNIYSVKGSDVGTGEGIFFSGGKYETKSVEGDITDFLEVGTEGYQQLFSKVFDMAASSFDQNPELSIEILTWLESVISAAPRMLADNEPMANLYIQVGNLKQFYILNNKGDNYVPSLDQSVYETTFTAYLDAMEGYQNKYERFRDQSSNIRDRMLEAELMLDTIGDNSSVQGTFVIRSESRIREIEVSLENILRQYNEQERNTRAAKLEFDIGLERWERYQDYKLAFEIISTLSSIASSYGSAITGGNDYASGIITDVTEASEEVKNMAARIKGLSTITEKLTNSIKGLVDLTTAIKTNMKYDRLIGKFNSINYDIPTLRESNTAWDALLIDAVSYLRLAVTNEVRGAIPYRAEVEKLVAYGKSFNAARIALVQEQSRLVDLLITQSANENEADRINSLIVTIEEDQSGLEELEQRLYRSLNSIKRPIYIALKNYESAFNYWSLSESSVQPSLNGSYSDYKSDYATLKEELESAYSNFYPVPQDFNDEAITLSDPEQLADFSEDGIINITVGLESPAFYEYDRVRINTVQAIIEGDELPVGTEFQVKIESNGEYKDKWESDQFIFNSRPLLRDFEYRFTGNGDGDIYILTSGTPSTSFISQYFQPTPFSTWTITLINKDEFDLSKVDSIRLEFSGSRVRNWNRE